MRLDEFVGNDNLINDISEAFKNGTLPHAVIIDGAPGTGKKTLARIISDYYVCLSDNDAPCGKCSGCIKAEHNSHPDIFVADGNNLSELSVDAIRRIRSDAHIMPNEAKTKVYLLLDCDRMMQPAQNAFLKVLEEPPANVAFIMTITSANMFLETVRSRSRIYTLYPPDAELTCKFLSERFPDKSPEEIINYARICDGNIGQTITLLESGGQEANQLAEEILKSLIKGNEYDLLLLTNKLSSNRVLASKVIDCMLEIISECLKAVVCNETGTGIVAEIVKRLSLKRIYVLAEKTERASQILKTNVNMNFFGTWLSSVLRNN